MPSVLFVGWYDYSTVSFLAVFPMAVCMRTIYVPLGIEDRSILVSEPEHCYSVNFRPSIPYISMLIIWNDDTTDTSP